jgi:hypothetical protein
MHSSIPNLTTAERRIRRGELALALRQAGKTFADIGLELGCSRARAQQIVARAAGAHWSAHLPGRVRTFLHHAGLAALPELDAAREVSQLSRRELLAAPNIGRAASAAVVVWLARHGLELQAKGAPSQGRLSHFTSPLAADRSHERNGWIRPPES